jgi:DHA2 family multidrug resistance protein-like MFS transporter
VSESIGPHGEVQPAGAGADAGVEPSSAETPRAGAREWIGLAMLALACLVYAMDLTVLELATPAISKALRPSGAELLWIADIYGFFVAGLLITMGTLGDRIGRRRLLLYGAAGFALASVLAALSTSAPMLIAARALLGFAGATVGPSTLSLIRTMFPDERQRTTAIGVWISSFSAGAVIGPLVGGVMLEFFWWGSVFLLAVPPMALLLVLGPKLLPEYRDPAPGHIDVLSAGMSLVAILAVIYGLKIAAEDGFSPLSAVSLIVGAALSILFVDRQRRLARPFIDLKLFRAPLFNASLAIYSLSFVAFGGATFLMALYLQLVLGLSPFVAGLWTVPQFVAFIVGSTLTPLIVQRLSPARFMTGGLVMAAAGFALFTQVQGPPSLTLLVAGSVIIALGLAPAFTLATDFVVGSAPPEHAGAAAAISETGSELGGALGIALLGSLATAVYRSRLGDSALAFLSPDAQRTARHTLGGATDVAATLPADRGDMLLSAARDAFGTGFHLVAAVGGLMIIFLAFVAARYIRLGSSASPP